MEVNCATTNWDGRSHVRLRGDLDFQSAPAVRAALQPLVESPGTPEAGGYPLAGVRVESSERRPSPLSTLHSPLLAGEAADALVLDLTELKYIDSSGISALVSTARQAQARGRDLRLVGASPHVQSLLSAAGFTRYFQVIEGELIPSRCPGAKREAKVWQHLAFTIPARTCLVKHIRVRVSEMLESLSPDSTLLDAVNLAVGEAASNAVRHGCREDERKKVRVQSATDGHTLVVEISDPGPGFDPDQIPSPEPGELREGGMGIYFMRITMDEVTYSFEEGTRVRLVKHLG